MATLEPAVYWKLRAHVAEARVLHTEGLRRQEQAERLLADAGAATVAAFKTAGLEMSPEMRVEFDDATLEVRITLPGKD